MNFIIYFDLQFCNFQNGKKDNKWLEIIKVVVWDTDGHTFFNIKQDVN